MKITLEVKMGNYICYQAFFHCTVGTQARQVTPGLTISPTDWLILVYFQRRLAFLNRQGSLRLWHRLKVKQLFHV